MSKANLTVALHQEIHRCPYRNKSKSDSAQSQNGGGNMSVAKEQNAGIVYTDNHHIPLGEAILLPSGELMLRVKYRDCRNKQRTEDILLTDLYKKVAATASRRNASA